MQRLYGPLLLLIGLILSAYTNLLTGQDEIQVWFRQHQAQINPIVVIIVIAGLIVSYRSATMSTPSGQNNRGQQGRDRDRMVSKGGVAGDRNVINQMLPVVLIVGILALAIVAIVFLLGRGQQAPASFQPLAPATAVGTSSNAGLSSPSTSIPAAVVSISEPTSIPPIAQPTVSTAVVVPTQIGAKRSGTGQIVFTTLRYSPPNTDDHEDICIVNPDGSGLGSSMLNGGLASST